MCIGGSCRGPEAFIFKKEKLLHDIHTRVSFKKKQEKKNRFDTEKNYVSGTYVLT